MPWRQVPTVSRTHKLHNLPSWLCYWRGLWRDEDREDDMLKVSDQHLLQLWIVNVHIVPQRHQVQRRPHWVWMQHRSVVQQPLQALLQLPCGSVPGLVEPHEWIMQVVPER